jgi:hypothetical protein
VKWQRWTVFAAALGGTVGFFGWAASRPATIRWAGRDHQVAMPAPHLCVQGSLGQATCLVIGDWDLHGFFTAKGATHGWRYDEQLGSAHSLSQGDLLLSVGRRQRGAAFLVELTLQLSSAPPPPPP